MRLTHEELVEERAQRKLHIVLASAAVLAMIAGNVWISSTIGWMVVAIAPLAWLFTSVSRFLAVDEKLARLRAAPPPSDET